MSAAPSNGRQRASLTGRAALLAIVALALVLTLAVPVRAWLGQRAQIAGLRADVEAAQQRVETLQVQQQRWDDPAFVAAEARRRLHFVLPGEVGYVALGIEDTASATPTAEAAAAAPWYSTLWDALQEADDRARAS